MMPTEHPYDENCHCPDCVDARIDEQHDGAIGRSLESEKLAERRRKERRDRIRKRRASRESGLARESDPSAPSVDDLNAMFDWE